MTARWYFRVTDGKSEAESDVLMNDDSSYAVINLLRVRANTALQFENNEEIISEGMLEFLFLPGIWNSPFLRGYL